MGGNTIVKDKNNKEVMPEQVNLSNVDRHELLNAVFSTLNHVNALFKQRYKRYLWRNFTSENMYKFLNGSSRWLLDFNQSDAFKYKANLGDIDIMIKREDGPDLFTLLDEETIFGYKGTNRAAKHALGNTIITAFDILGYNLQIDFELAEFTEDNLPSEWAVFSHSSSLDDAKIAVKGVFHKFALRALVGAIDMRDNIVIATPASTTDKFRVKKTHDIPRMLAFSIERGIAENYEHLHAVHEGKTVYRELKASEKKYSTDLEYISYTIFKKHWTEDSSQIKDFSSIMKNLKYLPAEVIERFAERFIDILYGEKGQNGQKLEPYNKALDKAIKTVAVYELDKALGENISITYKNKKDNYYGTRW